jgi:hypothetical protein
MSSLKETAQNTVLPGESTIRVSTQYDHEIQSVGARARVHIHATQAPDGPDALMLRSTEGTSKSDCTYWLDWGWEEDGLLGHVTYGLQAQRAFLKRQRTRAGAALRAVLVSPLFRDLFYDAVQHPKETKAIQKTADQLVDVHAKLAGVGEGGQMSMWAYPFLVSAESVEEALAALSEADEMETDPGSVTITEEDGRIRASGARTVVLERKRVEGLEHAAAAVQTQWRVLKEQTQGLGKTLVKAGPYLDAVEIAWNVSAALTHSRDEGLQKVQDPNFLGAAGAVASGVGGILIGGFFAGSVGVVGALGGGDGGARLRARLVRPVGERGGCDRERPAGPVDIRRRTVLVRGRPDERRRVDRMAPDEKRVGKGLLRQFRGPEGAHHTGGGGQRQERQRSAHRTGGGGDEAVCGKGFHVPDGSGRAAEAEFRTGRLDDGASEASLSVDHSRVRAKDARDVYGAGDY